ncbi:MAG: DUF4832 domain-containing protein [Deltaproteobacteria bacterium]|nr:DUF4832 domain-containing protein [Deltaproteobacteria bacterium]
MRRLRGKGALAALVLAAGLAAACGGGADGDGGANDGTDGVDAPVDSPPDGDAEADGEGEADGGTETDDASDDGAVALVTVTFEPTDEILLNPERGFYDGVDLVEGGDFSYVRENGRTLAHAGVRLDAYRDSPLDAPFLAALQAGLDDVRDAGIEVVLRFSYNEGPYPDPEPDAAKAQILAHLAQLAPLLEENRDVIAVLQAGFIGAWGEWHSSTHGLDNPADRGEILAAILDALPVSRMTQVRTPMYKSDAFGGPLDEADAFLGSDAARTGHHNDCFLASDSDEGTYDDPIEDWKDFVAAEGRFLPVGGETCATNAPRTDCTSATAELARLHYSYLNALYHPDVLAGWQVQGCYDELARRLGYRFVLVEASFPEAVPPGGVIELSVVLRNEGFAAPWNERPVEVLLDGRAAVLAEDPRRWESGEELRLAVLLRVPIDVAAGEHRLALRLPSAEASVAGRAEYAIRFANAGVWDESSAANVLTGALTVDPGAAGDIDPDATVFETIP